MDTKEKERYLEQLIWARQEVRDIDREIEMRRADNLRPRSTPYEREFVSGSRNNDDSTQVKDLWTIMQMEREQAQRRQLCLDLEQQIRFSIGMVPEQFLRRILTKRYLLGLKLSTVAAEIGYSTSRTSELAKLALESFTMPQEPIWL